MKEWSRKRLTARICIICQLFLYINMNMVPIISHAQEVVDGGNLEKTQITEREEDVKQVIENQEGESEEDNAGEIQNEEKVPEAQELDLGDYTNEMVVGERQLLIVTVLPLGASNEALEYYSSNESVAVINGMGRITAISAGTVQITISCGAITDSFQLIVKEKVEEKKIDVEDIEIADYEDTLEVDKTMNLSATVLPVDAEEHTISYSTSDSSIASVKQSGEVKGISPGNVIISIKAGNIVRNVDLKIKIGTTGIELEKSYITLKKGESYQIMAKIIPEGASQKKFYKSSNDIVASVDSEGMVKANKNGSATIIVSNEDISSALTVIVNEEQKKIEDMSSKENLKSEEFTDKDELLLARLDREDCVDIKAEEYGKLSKVVLRYLHEKHKTIIISAEKYTITVNGRNIVNWENELYTYITLEKSEEGHVLQLNKGKNLPGEIKIELADEIAYKYVYLYNNIKERYEWINQPDHYIKLDLPGEYFLSLEKLKKVTVSQVIPFGASLTFLCLVILYFLAKKRYLFW